MIRFLRPGRRALLKAGGALMLSGIVPSLPGARSAWGAASIDPIDIRFDAFWGDDRIGFHEIKVSPSSAPDAWKTETRVDMKVDLGLFGNITFRHSCSETWEEGALQSLVSETDDDGEVFSVSGRRKGPRIELNGPGGPSSAPGNLLTTNSAWSVAICSQAHLIDVTHGEVIGLVAEQGAPADVQTEDGAVTADRYQVMSPLIAGELFYGVDGVWLGGTLQRSGEDVEYVRVR